METTPTQKTVAKSWFDLESIKKELIEMWEILKGLVNPRGNMPQIASEETMKIFDAHAWGYTAFTVALFFFIVYLFATRKSDARSTASIKKYLLPFFVIPNIHFLGYLQYMFFFLEASQHDREMLFKPISWMGLTAYQLFLIQSVMLLTCLIAHSMACSNAHKAVESKKNRKDYLQRPVILRAIITTLGLVTLATSFGVIFISQVPSLGCLSFILLLSPVILLFFSFVVEVVLVPCVIPFVVGILSGIFRSLPNWIASKFVCVPVQKVSVSEVNFCVVEESNGFKQNFYGSYVSIPRKA